MIGLMVHFLFGIFTARMKFILKFTGQHEIGFRTIRFGGVMSVLEIDSFPSYETRVPF